MKLNQWTLLSLIAPALLLSACTSNRQIPPEPEQAQVAEPAPKIEVIEEVAEIPTRPFADDSLYDLLVAEFAVRRNQLDLALGTYLQQAHKTRDIGVVTRATRLAQYLRADNATLDAAQLWVELDPTNVEAQYSAATILAKSKRPLEALKHMEAVLENGGKTNFAAIVANSLKLSPEKLAKIEVAIDQLLVKYQQQTQLLTAKTLILQQRGENEAALKLIQKVLAIDENDMHAVVVEARMLYQLKRFDKSLARLLPAVEKQPQNRRLRLELARLLMPRHIDRAQNQFEILLKQTPNDPDLLLSLALINKEGKNFTKAEHYFRKLLTTGKRNSDAQLHLGQLAEMRSDWRKAIRHYSAIKPGKGFFVASNRIINLYLEQGLIKTARDYLANLRKRYSKLVINLYLLEADVLLRSKRYEEGHKLVTEALLINPEHLNLLYIRSVFSEKRSDLDLMERDLQLIINLDPNNATALNALGYVLANHSKRLEQAYDLIKRAIAIKPNEPAIMDSMGWVEYRLGNLAASVEILRKAYKVFPDQEVGAHLGEVLWKIGELEQAEEILKKAFERNPDSLILKETIDRLLNPPAPAVSPNETPIVSPTSVTEPATKSMPNQVPKAQ